MTSRSIAEYPCCGMTQHDLIERDLTYDVIGAFFEVYNTLGYGFLEQIYVEALAIELRERGHLVERELPASVRYKGHVIARHRLDMVVDGRVVVEAKAGPRLSPFAARQLYNYLRATDLSVGLLLHFGPEATHHRVVCDRARLTRSGPETSIQSTIEDRGDLPPIAAT
jgi:GxxExxY protein